MKPKVVLIAGSAHGGTTITSLILGQHPEIFVTGKLRGFPAGSLFEAENLCSCGEKADACEFWLKVRERYATVQELPDSERIPRLYELISNESGRTFTGDVTHSLKYARTLQALEGIDLHLVHVVRAAPAVVFSRIRKDYREQRLTGSDWRRVRRVIQASRRWRRHLDGFGELERNLGPRAVRIRYEALCTEPGDTLADIGRTLGLDFGDVAESLKRGESLRQVPHLLRGNVSLRKQKEIKLHQDHAYRSEMKQLDRMLVSVFARSVD